MTKKTRRELLAEANLRSQGENIRAQDRREADVKYARQIIAEAACRVGDEAIVDIILPTLDRVIRGDVQIVDLAGSEGAGLVKALRVPGLAARLRKVGVADELAAVAVRFACDFEKARIGGMVANYDGYSGGVKRSSEPERWCIAIDRLAKASDKLEADERVVVFAYVMLDMSAADTGNLLCGDLTSDANAKIFLGKYLLHKSLKKLKTFYEDWDWKAEERAKMEKSA